MFGQPLEVKEKERQCTLLITYGVLDEDQASPKPVASSEYCKL